MIYSWSVKPMLSASRRVGQSRRKGGKAISPLARETSDAAICGHTRLDPSSRSKAPLATARKRYHHQNQARISTALSPPHVALGTRRGRSTYLWSPGGRRGSGRRARGARARRPGAAAAPRPGTAGPARPAPPWPSVPAERGPPPPPPEEEEGEERAVGLRWGQVRNYGRGWGRRHARTRISGAG
jgi:hypothetical protein